MSRVTALRAPGLLGEFGAAGVLNAADVHVARRLGALVGETDERVLLAVALTVRGTRAGSVVLDLATAADTIAPELDESAERADDGPADAVDARMLPWPDVPVWVEACARSPLVTGASGTAPVHLVDGRLWLDRYWHQEVQVADDLLRRKADRPHDLDPAQLDADLDSLFDADSDQRAAVAVAASARVAVVAGGPGTGKTTTVAQLISVLVRGLGDGLRIALAAPTGKAAARLEEAVHSARARLTDADRAVLAGLSASTLHRLLGWRPGTSSRFKHDRDNHLPYDVVIVDESSMVSLTLMARLLEALAPHTRLVLVGDPDQLASVEAGAVLGDLVDPSTRLRDSVVALRTVHRFDSSGPIAELAGHVRAGRGDEALELLRAAPDGLTFDEVDDDAAVAGAAVAGAALAAVQARVLAHERALIAAAAAGDTDAALVVLEQHRLLCAHRSGQRGVRHWTDVVQRWLAADIDARGDGRYAGQPLLVTTNDYEVGLYNGDTGVVVHHRDDLAAAFRRGGTATIVPLVRLGDVRTMHAMTVHRAQGSQFDDVTVVLPLATSPLATRQTLYTAVTRATRSVRVIGSAEALLTCVRRPVARATGLRERLAQD